MCSQNYTQRQTTVQTCTYMFGPLRSGLGKKQTKKKKTARISILSITFTSHSVVNCLRPDISRAT